VSRSEGILKKAIAVNENHPKCNLISLMQIRSSFKCLFEQLKDPRLWQNPDFIDV
jgi:hypothetical protein